MRTNKLLRAGGALALACLLYTSTNTFKFNFTTSFQDPFMLAFFTTVGLGASFSLLKKGGRCV